MKAAARATLVVVTCLVAAACATTEPGLRPRANGFGAAGVADPYGDGRQHLMAGRYDVAVQRFGQALTRDRHSVDALNGLAIAHTRLGRFDLAQNYFERALQLDPTNPVTLNNYGWALVEQGRLREATPFLGLALRHAAAAEAPVIAANLERMRGAPPPALVAVLEHSSEPASPRHPHRLVRVDADAYRLETRAEGVEPPAPPSTIGDAPLPQATVQQNPGAIGSTPQRAARPDARAARSVAAQAAGTAGLAPAAREQIRAAPPEPGNPVTPPSGGAPIQLWPQPIPASEAGPILPGETR